MIPFLRSLLAVILTSAGVLDAADQTGAEKTRQPVSAQIIVQDGAESEGTPVGNVRVTYADGSTDLWTTKGNCALARVAPDGLVGWTVRGPETKIAASYTVRPNGTLVLCRKGRVIAEVKSAKGFIEEWAFVENGSRLVLVTRGAHGPGYIELHDTAAGKLIESVKASTDNLPLWARPYAER